MTEKNMAFRILMLITTPNLADKATEVLSNEGVFIENRFSAMGTATSKVMDILGLGSIDKIIMYSILPKNISPDILRKLSKKLGLGSANSGIAFTIPITGMNNSMVKMLQEIDNEPRKEYVIMSDSKYSLIIADVNRGYSNQVMDAAREAGASGGSVINSRRIADEAACSKWGLGDQEEKEIVLIVADDENKVAIMRKISEKCGAHSEAKGAVFSVALDEVEGL